MNVKASYSFRACWFDDIEDATPEELSDLLGAMRDYHFGREHKFETRGAEMVFRNIRRTFELDIERDSDLSAVRSAAGKKGAEARKRALEAQKNANSSGCDDDDASDDLEGAEYPPIEQNKQNEFCQNLPNGKSGKSKQALINKKRTKNKDKDKDKDSHTPIIPAPSKSQKKSKSETKGDCISQSQNGLTHSGQASGGSSSAFSPPSLKAWKDHAQKINWKADTIIKAEAEISAAFFYWQKVGWRLKNGSQIIDWRAACADAKIRADVKAGRMSDEIVESLIAPDNAPTGWRVHVANRTGVNYEDLKLVKWADYIATSTQEERLAIMRLCLCDDDNRHLLDCQYA